MSPFLGFRLKRSILYNLPFGEVYKRFYRPQRSWGKVIFSEACVRILPPGGLHDGIHPPWVQRQTPPGSRQPPRADAPLEADTPQEQTPSPTWSTHPPGSRHPPPIRPARRSACWEIWATVLILLECILVELFLHPHKFT